jgi:hypothetical protein
MAFVIAALLFVFWYGVVAVALLGAIFSANAHEWLRD